MSVASSYKKPLTPFSQKRSGHMAFWMRGSATDGVYFSTMPGIPVGSDIVPRLVPFKILIYKMAGTSDVYASAGDTCINVYVNSILVDVICITDQTWCPDSELVIIVDPCQPIALQAYNPGPSPWENPQIELYYVEV